MGVGLILIAFLGSGCASQKPLPFAYSTPAPAAVGAPQLTVRPTLDGRLVMDEMDDALQLPECLDPVLVKELEGAGLFSRVELSRNGAPTAGYALQCRINDLRWESSDYERMQATSSAVVLVTGAAGGVIYGSTGIEVLGRASVHFRVTNAQGDRRLLDRDYTATARERKTKLKCDKPDTYREVAAMALRSTFDEFEKDIRQLNLK